MSDKWSMTLSDVRAAFSEVITLYLQAMRTPGRVTDHQLAARLAQAGLSEYLRPLNITEVQAELEQTQRLLGQWRSSLPHPFEDDADR